MALGARNFHRIFHSRALVELVPCRLCRSKKLFSDCVFPDIPKVGLRFLENRFDQKLADVLHGVRKTRFTSHIALRSFSSLNYQQKLSEGKEKKRKKFKGKRALVKWLKYFRWKKKKEFERMSLEEKILYKLKKARRKEERLVAVLRKLQPKQPINVVHDPEILSPEEHFYYLKMGHKCKNYVPVGKRGIFGGVILNMHLHWKKHQTVKIIVKTYSPDEVREIASELAKLTGGIVLDVYDGNKIIMYRGRNYSQPPTEIMKPRNTLSKNKALTKARSEDALTAVRAFIERLERDLENVRGNSIAERQVSCGHECRTPLSDEQLKEKPSDHNYISSDNLDTIDHFADKNISYSSGFEEEHYSETEFHTDSDESLSDHYEIDSGMNSDSSDASDGSLYLEKINAAQLENKKSLSSFSDRHRTVEKMDDTDSSSDGSGLSQLDEVDQMFLHADSLFRRKK